MIVSSGIAKNGLSNSEINPCGDCSLRVNAKLVLFVQCGKWVHCRCAGMNMVTSRF